MFSRVSGVRSVVEKSKSIDVVETLYSIVVDKFDSVMVEMSESDAVYDSLVVDEWSEFAAVHDSIVVVESSESTVISDSSMVEQSDLVVCMSSDSKAAEKLDSNAMENMNSKDMKNLNPVAVENLDSGHANSATCVEAGHCSSFLSSLGCSWTPICSDELKPYKGMIFDSYDASINFYAEYARVSGFGFRLSSKKRFADGSTRLQYVICNRAGFSDSNQSVDTVTAVESTKRICRSSRCGCLAKFLIRCVDGGKFVVYDFQESHNHCFTTEAGKQFLRVNRKLTFAQKKFLMDCGHVGIGATRAYRIMKQMVGGYCYIGATLNDCKNFKRDLKTFIGGGDAQMVVDRFLLKKTTCGYFFEYFVDTEGTLCRLFWADPESIKYCNLFGDVVCFDATYSSNKYKMVFVPFTGVDNHRSSVTFAAGLITNEDTASYLWLLGCFKKLLGREPIVIVSDQDKAMKAAISEIFGTSHHRLCMWHIMEKLRAKVGVPFCNETDFVKDLSSVVWSDYIDPADFEFGWKSVIEKHGLQGHVWLSEMYDLRSNWIPAFFRDVKMGGLLRTTSRSESENSFFGKFLHSNMTLVEFFMGFETAMDDQRQKRSKLDHENMNSFPRRITPLPIELDAAKIYTYNIFKFIQSEIYASVYECSIELICDDADELIVYRIKDKNHMKHRFQVSYSRSSRFASCSCKKFEMTGIICSHIFHVFNVENVATIAEVYVLNRWRKEPVLVTEDDCLHRNEGNSGTVGQIYGIVSEIWSEFRSFISLQGNDIEKLKNALDIVVKLKDEHAGCEGTNKPTSNSDFF